MKNKSKNYSSNKIYLLVLRIFIIIIILLILGSYINHKIKLNKEENLFVPMGEMVDVNGYKIHVYSEGEGDIPLVFMSGAGTSAPVLDFKSLYSLLSDEYKVVVVERAGYGFSDIVDIERDIDTVLDETREALEETEITGPFILFPHSLSGIEALYWAQKYPDEVKAIVGLDMAVPELYKEHPINIPMMKLASFVAKLGFTRLIPNLSESDAIKYGTLTEDEKKLYKTVFYRRTITDTMIEEAKEVKVNASKVGENKLPYIPILAFVSNGEGTGWSKSEWRKFIGNTIGNLDKGEVVYLDCSHYIQDIEYKRIAKDSKRFINSLNNK